jgi:hypothetical protein
MKNLRPEVRSAIKGRGGLVDAFDDMMKASYNVTEEEYDFILNQMTDDELEAFVLGPNPSFAEKRASVMIRNKYLAKLSCQLVEPVELTDLEKYELVNRCETSTALSEAILKMANPKTGMIRGRLKEFNAERMAANVNAVISGFPANLLTREYGIRQQALYLKYHLNREASI